MENSRTATRALELFEVFATAGRPLSLSELARVAKLPVSTCHGVVKALARGGWLYYPKAREVYPTRKFWELGKTIDARDPLTSTLEPLLGQLRDQSGETVILGGRDADSVLYLLVCEGGQTVRYTAHVGEHKPLHSSAIGKVLLAEMSPAALDAWLSERPLKRVTDRTLVTRESLQVNLQRARKRGYFVTQGENVADVMALAAPVRFGSATYGVAIAGPLHRMQPAETEHARRLLRCVRQIEKTHGGP